MEKITDVLIHNMQRHKIEGSIIVNNHRNKVLCFVFKQWKRQPVSGYANRFVAFCLFVSVDAIDNTVTEWHYENEEHEATAKAKGLQPIIEQVLSTKTYQIV